MTAADLALTFALSTLVESCSDHTADLRAAAASATEEQRARVVALVEKLAALRTEAAAMLADIDPIPF